MTTGLAMSRRGPKAFLAAAAATSLVCALAGCSAAAADSSVTPMTTTPTTTATSSTSTSAPSTPADARVLQAAKANATLTASLYSMVALMRKLQTDTNLAEPRKALTDASAGARSLLKRQRTAAYTTTPRSCSTVRSLEAQVRSQARAADVAYDEVQRQVTLLKADIAALDKSMATVTTQRAALTAALKGLATPPVTLTTTEVTSALSGATESRKETLATIAAVTSSGADALDAAEHAGSQARQITSNAC